MENYKIDRMNLRRCIDEFVAEAPLSEPMTTDEIYAYVLSKMPDVSKSNFNVSMQRYERKNPGLARYKKGVYYKKIDTPFGDSGINLEEMIRRTYLLDGDDVIGYERGPSLMNKLGLTTQIPGLVYLATMKVRCSRNDPKQFLSLSKPITTVNKENFRYLQFLDLLQNKEKVSVESDNPLPILKNLIDRYSLTYEKLIWYAHYFNSKEVYDALSHIAGGNP